MHAVNERCTSVFSLRRLVKAEGKVVWSVGGQWLLTLKVQLDVPGPNYDHPNVSCFPLSPQRIVLGQGGTIIVDGKLRSNMWSILSDDRTETIASVTKIGLSKVVGTLK